MKALITTQDKDLLSKIGFDVEEVEAKFHEYIEKHADLLEKYPFTAKRKYLHYALFEVLTQRLTNDYFETGEWIARILDHEKGTKSFYAPQTIQTQEKVILLRTNPIYYDVLNQRNASGSYTALIKKTHSYGYGDYALRLIGLPDISHNLYRYGGDTQEGLRSFYNAFGNNQIPLGETKIETKFGKGKDEKEKNLLYCLNGVRALSTVHVYDFLEEQVYTVLPDLHLVNLLRLIEVKQNKFVNAIKDAVPNVDFSETTFFVAYKLNEDGSLADWYFYLPTDGYHTTYVSDGVKALMQPSPDDTWEVIMISPTGGSKKIQETRQLTTEVKRVPNINELLLDVIVYHKIVMNASKTLRSVLNTIFTQKSTGLTHGYRWENVSSPLMAFLLLPYQGFEELFEQGSLFREFLLKKLRLISPELEEQTVKFLSQVNESNYKVLQNSLLLSRFDIEQEKLNDLESAYFKNRNTILDE